MVDENRLQEIECIYDLNRIESPNFAKYIRELIGGCRELDKEVTDWRMRFEVAFENNIQYIYENKKLENTKHELVEQAEKLFETIETAISELQFLERSLNLPERGYDRNNFNRVMRTLKEGVKDETTSS